METCQVVEHIEIKLWNVGIFFIIILAYRHILKEISLNLYVMKLKTYILLASPIQ